jgi:hypothetical protein
LTRMNDWDIYIEEWISRSSMAFAEYEFDLIKEEPFIGFDKITEVLPEFLMMN